MSPRRNASVRVGLPPVTVNAACRRWPEATLNPDFRRLSRISSRRSASCSEHANRGVRLSDCSREVVWRSPSRASQRFTNQAGCECKIESRSPSEIFARRNFSGGSFVSGCHVLAPHRPGFVELRNSRDRPSHSIVDPRGRKAAGRCSDRGRSTPRSSTCIIPCQ